MKCPFITDRTEAHFPQKPIVFTEDVETPDGLPDKLHLYNSATIINIKETMHECLKENCASWKNNNCVRR